MATDLYINRNFNQKSSVRSKEKLKEKEYTVESYIIRNSHIFFLQSNLIKDLISKKKEWQEKKDKGKFSVSSFKDVIRSYVVVI